MTDTAILVRNLHKSFGKTEVLHGIDLAVAPKEVTCLIGPSGSGKSTLLRCIAFLEEATSGSILVEGQPLGFEEKPDGSRQRLPQARIRAVRSQIGMVFQQFNLWPHMTALGNVSEALKTARGMPRKDAEERAMAQLSKVGLANRAEHYPSQLSGGQQQRVAIARALINNPPLLFADEPTGNLDSRTSKEVLQMFEQLNAEEGITIILVTHDANVAHTARRTIRISDGLIEAGAFGAEGNVPAEPGHNGEHVHAVGSPAAARAAATVAAPDSEVSEVRAS
jgi:polar amino acid transport system ATP-binding protein